MQAESALTLKYEWSLFEQNMECFKWLCRPTSQLNGDIQFLQLGCKTHRLHNLVELGLCTFPNLQWPWSHFPQRCCTNILAHQAQDPDTLAPWDPCCSIHLQVVAQDCRPELFHLVECVGQIWDWLGHGSDRPLDRLNTCGCIILTLFNFLISRGWLLCDQFVMTEAFCVNSSMPGLGTEYKQHGTCGGSSYGHIPVITLFSMVSMHLPIISLCDAQ